jgi:hypothetical protein
MKFDRYDVKGAARSRSPQRIHAAKRAVSKEAEDMALFPEMRRYSTPEERLDQVDGNSADFTARMRQFLARTWRDGRARLRALPPERRAIVMEHWNSNWGPKREASYFADLVHQVESGRLTAAGYRIIPASQATALCRNRKPSVPDNAASLGEDEGISL